jgi:hypothetical protein
MSGMNHFSSGTQLGPVILDRYPAPEVRARHAAAMGTPRRHRPAATASALIAGLLLSIAACSTGGDLGSMASDAACAAPEVKLSVAEASPSETVTVVASNLFSDCYDTGQGGTPPALADVDIIFSSGSQSTVVATVDADAAGTFSADIQIPADAATGDASFWVEASKSAPIIITPPTP